MDNNVNKAFDGTRNYAKSNIVDVKAIKNSVLKDLDARAKGD